jgi:hypothetical protein
VLLLILLLLLLLLTLLLLLKLPLTHPTPPPPTPPKTLLRCVLPSPPQSPLSTRQPSSMVAKCKNTR